MSDPNKENKRLYALDEAVVGPEEAPKRWQYKSIINGKVQWRQPLGEPSWGETFEYRRDPEAPPLPSLDWIDAPDWANYAIRKDGERMWFHYRPETSRYIEERPNPEWFSVIRAYEATKEDDMDEYLTGPALHRAIADAQEAGEGPEVFEHFSNVQKCWVTASNWTFLVGSDSDGNKIRRKPRRRHLTTQDGQRYEWPEPITETPRHLQPVYVVDPCSPSLYRHVAWQHGVHEHDRYLRAGLLFKKSCEAQACSRALIAASGGSCD